jgi:prepilin-type N-terminal cleavage/methylation domain-containing protein
MKNQELVRGHRGFTLIELLVVLAVAMVLMLISIPSMFTAMHQGKLRGIAQETAVLMRQARLDAVKLSAQSVVRVVLPAGDAPGHVEAFSDRNRDGMLTAGEPILGRLYLPTGIKFLAPPDVEGSSSIEGFTVDPEDVSNPRIAIFDSSGAVAAVGAFRFADTYENYLEVRVEPAATARIEVRKAREEGSVWKWYASGDGEEAWKWN